MDKYEYTPEDQRLLAQAMFGGGRLEQRSAFPVYSGTIEIMALSIGALALLLQVADSKSVSSLYAKIIGNVLSDKMPSSVKRSTLQGFFVAGLREQPEEVKKIIRRMDSILDEPDMKMFSDMVDLEDDV